MAPLGKQRIYVIEHELGPVKIGIAKDPKQRLTNLQVSCPFELRLKKTATPTDAQEVEKYLHSRFKKYHMRGEWFDIPEYDRDFEIPTHISDSGKPNTPVEVTYGRDLDHEWAGALKRFFRAMKATKHQTVSIGRIKEECQKLARSEEEPEEDGQLFRDTPTLFDTKDDIPKNEVRCSNCGHTFTRSQYGR